MKNSKNFMKLAYELGLKGEGTVSPNPMVGAVVVKDGEVIGKGFHKKAGDPHAEVFALEEAGEEPVAEAQDQGSQDDRDYDPYPP